MKNKTAVEWLIEQWPILEAQIPERILEAAKEMEKEQKKNAIKNELKLVGSYFDVSKLDPKEQKHHIRFTCILKDRFDFYNETYGDNNE